MKERPILFSGPMVRAILEGRKTQTRRIYKPKSGFPREDVEITPTTQDLWIEFGPCPFGTVGTRLWVRETWNISHKSHLAPGEVIGKEASACVADNNGFAIPCADGVVYKVGGYSEHPKFGKALWRPSIHMPRWASRLTLEITGVRVERLQQISRGDAMEEGCPFSNMADGPSPVAWYAALWDEINGPGSWDANPFVWVVEFRKTEDNR